MTRHATYTRPVEDDAMEAERRDNDMPDEPADSATAEQLLDLAIELTFPASDPVSVVSAFQAARLRADQT
jgi:hypothetical protein